jgi:hypothetical protein
MLPVETSAPPLRIGLLLDSTLQPAWVCRILREIKSSSTSVFGLVVLNGSRADSPGPTGNRLQRYWENRQHLLYALYCRMDNAHFPEEFDAFRQVDISDLVSGCPVMEVTPIKKKYSDSFSDEDIEQILAHKLDVTLRFGFRILRGKALKIAKYGVWSHHHGDNLVNRGGPAGFWEVMDREPVTGSILQILTEDLDNGKTICRAWSPTTDRFSVKTNRNNYYWKSTSLVPKKLRELHAWGSEALQPDSYATHHYSHRLYKTPVNSEMLPLIGRLSRDYLLKKVEHRLSFDQWMLAYRFRTNRNDTNRSPHKFRFLVPPKDKFWADPFPVKMGDKYFVLFEEYLYQTGKAHISLLELGRDGTVSDPVVVLDRDYHLSYPFVFEWRGTHYMIPESSANGRVEIYRSTAGLHEWKLEGVLLDNIHAADATIHEVDGRWWMFLSSSMKGLYNWDELHIYHAESPMGPWTPHRRNPVKMDARNSRPAGKLFQTDEGLFRPAQDCSVRYGYATTINRITHLSPSRFEEETVSTILPKWKKGIVATHTLNSDADLTVIDCQMKRSRFFRH